MGNTFNNLHKYIRTIKEYKDFTKFLTISKIKEFKTKLFFGNFWFLFETILWIAIYVFLIQIIFKKNDSSLILYITPGILSWTWFRKTISACNSIFRKNKQLIKSSYFPKYILILSENILQLINFIITTIIVILLLTLFNQIPTIYILFIIPIAIIQFALTLGISGLIANSNVFFKDSEKIINYGLRILFYLSPGIYAISQIPEKLKNIYVLNPFTTIFASFRDAMIFNQTPGLKRLTAIFIISLFLIIISIILIQKNEGDYAKEI